MISPTRNSFSQVIEVRKFERISALHPLVPK